MFTNNSDNFGVNKVADSPPLSYSIFTMNKFTIFTLLATDFLR